MSKRCTECLLLEQKVATMEKEFNQSVKEIKLTMKEFHQSMENKMTDLFNHQSSRVPQPVAWALAGLSSLLTAIITAAITHMIR